MVSPHFAYDGKWIIDYLFLQLFHLMTTTVFIKGNDAPDAGQRWCTKVITYLCGGQETINTNNRPG
jgi:hypothetical protein